MIMKPTHGEWNGARVGHSHTMLLPALALPLWYPLGNSAEKRHAGQVSNLAFPTPRIIDTFLGNTVRLILGLAPCTCESPPFPRSPSRPRPPWTVPLIDDCESILPSRLSSHASSSCRTAHDEVHSGPLGLRNRKVR